MLVLRAAATQNGGPPPGSPVNLTPPAITGTLRVGQVLTASGDTWLNAVTRKIYIWTRNGTVIPNQLGNTCKLPPISANDNIKVEVAAVNAVGQSYFKASAVTGAVARNYLASAFAGGEAWSCCMGIYPGYVSNLVTLYMDGNTLVMPQNAKGLLDFATIIAWWITQPSYTGYGGVMPRVQRMWSQGLTPGAHFEQLTPDYMPVFDLNNIKWDGTIPVAINGYNARDSLWDGTEPQLVAIPATIPEANTYMAVTGGTIAYKTCDHTLALCVDGVSNIGTTATGPQIHLAGMKALTNAAVNSWGLRCGKGNWAGQYGYGVTSGTGATGEYPATTLQAMTSRHIVCEMQSTNPADNIDGFSAVAATNAVVNIRVNNDVAGQWTANTTVGRTGSTGVNNGLVIGRGPAAAPATVDACGFGLYGAVYVNNPISQGNAPVVDNRVASYNSLMECFNVRTDYTTNIVTIGASSMTGYAGNAGMGISVRLAELFGPKVRTTSFALTSARLSTLIYPNRVALAAAAVVAGVRNIAIIYAAAPDIGQAPYNTGVATADWAGQIAQYLKANGFYEVYISQFIAPQFLTTGNPLGPAGAMNEVLTGFNPKVVEAAHNITYNYKGIALVDTLASTLTNAGNWHYQDTTSHPRTELTHGNIASMFANRIAADVI